MHSVLYKFYKTVVQNMIKEMIDDISSLALIDRILLPVCCEIEILKINEPLINDWKSCN